MLNKERKKERKKVKEHVFLFSCLVGTYKSRALVAVGKCWIYLYRSVMDGPRSGAGGLHQHLNKAPRFGLFGLATCCMAIFIRVCICSTHIN